MLPSLAVQQQAGGFDSRSAQHDYASKCLVALLCHLIDERNAPGLAGVRVNDDVTRYRFGSKRQAAGFFGCGESRARTAEVRISRTASITVTAVMTRRAAVVPL